MGPFTTLFERRTPATKQHSTLGVQLPNPTPLPISTAEFEGETKRRSFGPRLPSFTYAPPAKGHPPVLAPEAGPSRIRQSVPEGSDVPLARQSWTERPSLQTETLSERVAALRLRGDEPSASSGANPPPIPPRPSNYTPQAAACAVTKRHSDTQTKHLARSVDPVRPSPIDMSSKAGVPSGSATVAYSPVGGPSPMPRPPTTCIAATPRSIPQDSSFSSSRNPFAPFPCPRPPGHSYSAPILSQHQNGTPDRKQKQNGHMQQQHGLGAASPVSPPSRTAASSGAENSAPNRKVGTVSAPTSPFAHGPFRPDSALSPNTPPGSSPSRRKGAGETRQCAGITATSRRCTRMVSLAAWQLSTAADAPTNLLRPMSSASTAATETEPVYCRQHAKLALADSGCFLARRSSSSVSQEHWATFADWIDDSLPVETQALLRHYMTAPISEHDTSGYLYVYELVPRAFRSSPTAATTAHIKLGRTIKPVARLSQWRAMCPSREPIVRFVFPRPPTGPHPASNGSPSGHAALRFADSGSTNHHRWERLCLVELAGRAIGGAQAERCTDCGSKHVECFVIERAALSARGAAGWSVEQTVQKWGRWCRDHAG